MNFDQEGIESVTNLILEKVFQFRGIFVMNQFGGQRGKRTYTRERKVGGILYSYERRVHHKEVSHANQIDPLYIFIE